MFIPKTCTKAFTLPLLFLSLTAQASIEGRFQQMSETALEMVFQVRVCGPNIQKQDTYQMIVTDSKTFKVIDEVRSDDKGCLTIEDEVTRSKVKQLRSYQVKQSQNVVASENIILDPSKTNWAFMRDFNAIPDEEKGIVLDPAEFDLSVGKVNLTAKALKIESHDDSLKSGFNLGKFDISKVKDRRITRTFLFNFGLRETLIPDANLQMKMVLPRNGSLYSNSESSQVVTKTVELRAGQIITPVQVECMLIEADNKLGVEAYCPQSFSVSFEIEGASTKNRSAWSYSIDFSKNNHSGEMIGL